MRSSRRMKRRYIRRSRPMNRRKRYTRIKAEKKFRNLGVGGYILGDPNLEGLAAPERVALFNNSLTSSGHLFFPYNIVSMADQPFFPRIYQGVRPDERVGRSIFLTGMRMNMRLTPQGNNMQASQVRIIIFQARKDTTASLGISDILDYDPLSTTNSNPVNPIYSTASNYNITNRARVRIAYDKTIRIPPSSVQTHVNTSNQDDQGTQFFQGGANVAGLLRTHSRAKDIVIRLRCMHTVRYNDDYTSVPPRPVVQYGDYGMILLANTGNKGATNDIFGHPIRSGIDVEWNVRWFYTDT